MSRFIKPIWFLSFLAVFFAFILVYANLGEAVTIYQDLAEGKFSVLSKSSFFNWGIGMIMGTNVLLYVFAKLLKITWRTDKTFLQKVSDWFIVLAVVLNFFYLVSTLFIMFFNTQENFNPAFLGNLIRISIGVMIVWLLRLILLLIRRK